jgi:fumarate hydratase subunit beta
MEIRTPITEDVRRSLKVGQLVEITGEIYSARDAAHKRMAETLKAGGKAPIPFEGNIVYYTGPTPPREGMALGSAGPTTSMRMDAFWEELLPFGLLTTLGKGGRGPELRKKMKQLGAVYFMAVGGTGALLTQHITKAEVVAYEDLGTEAIRRLTVEKLPAIVCVDAEGHDLLEEGKAKWRRTPSLATAGNPANGGGA